MAKKKAPVALTGGRGFSFEDHVAARFLVDLLAGAAPLGLEVGTVVRLDWQTVERDGSLDDLVIAFLSADGIERRMPTSIKSHRQVTSRGYNRTFVQAAWEQWRGTGTDPFRRNRDLLGLVTGQLADSVRSAWDGLLSEALAVDAARLEARLRAPASRESGSTSSAVRRALFDSFARPTDLLENRVPDAIGQAELLRHVRLLHFDFAATASRDAASSIERCRELLESGSHTEAERLWLRLVGVASSRRVQGGTIDLPQLLTELRGAFQLRGHPDYAADWDAIGRIAAEEVDDVREDLGGVVTLLRGDVLDRVTVAWPRSRVCVLVGESGCGKTAIARMLARRYRRVVWLSSGQLEVGSLVSLCRALGIRHPLGDVVQASADPCLVIVDSPERCSTTGLQLLARLIRHLRESVPGEHLHVLLTVQPDSLDAVLHEVFEPSLEALSHHVIVVQSPDEAEVAAALWNVANIPAFLVRQEFRPLLRNLKVVDWLFEAAQAGDTDRTAPVGHTALIDWIWKCWVVEHDRKLFRGEILKSIAVLEADSLAVGLPLAKLPAPHQELLPELSQLRLVRVRSERVFLAHDLLGEWARLKVLIGEPPTESVEMRQRASGVRWYRAMRLYGRYLLEQDTGDAWRSAIQTIGDRSTEDRLIQDLLLDSVLLTGSVAALERAWSKLNANDGRLLKRLLSRMEAVATVPVEDVRVNARDGIDCDPTWVRAPFPPSWLAVIIVMERHPEDVFASCFQEAAEVCHTWLLLTDGGEDRNYPGRAQAARLAVRLAREAQARRAEGNRWRDDVEQAVYQAALLAARDLPDDVGQLALELAQRRDPSPEVQRRANQARERAAAEQRRHEASQADAWRQRQRLLATRIPDGPLRPAWPDGPAARVSKGFREACLQRLGPLIDSRPRIALEVLLGVSIEEPRHEERIPSSIRQEYGVQAWESGYPPMYFRGPFLYFLRQAPNEGLEFVLRLVNFATHQRIEQERRRLQHLPEPSGDHLQPIAVHLEGSVKLWWGDSQVFSWTEWPLDSKILSSALMALEKWLDEQLEAGVYVKSWIERILERSESVAFAGILLTLAKKHHGLLVGSARPLLGSWQFYYWDNGVAKRRTGFSPPMIAWYGRSRDAVDLARQWHLAPHRATLLMEVVQRELVMREELGDYFAAVRERWAAESASLGASLELDELIARFDPSNYRAHRLDDDRVEIRLERPQALQARLERETKPQEEHMELMLFPFRCHRLLKGELSMADEELPAFWESVVGHERAWRTPGAADATEVNVRLDAVCGGIAVLLSNHLGWVRAEPERELWCRHTLQAVLESCAPREEFDYPESIGEWEWDLYLAEAAIVLLAENASDELGLRLAGAAITEYHYRATTRVMERAYASRTRLGGVFSRMQTAAILWAALRGRVPRSQDPVPWRRWYRWREQLLRAFCAGALPVGLSLRRVCQVAARASAIRQRWQQQSMRSRSRPNVTVAEPSDFSGQDDPGLDVTVLSAAFTWLDPGAAADGRERRLVLERLEDLLAVSLRMSPSSSGSDRLPYDFDKWVFKIVARAIAFTDDVEEVRGLWEPLLPHVDVAADWVEQFLWELFCATGDPDCQPETFVRQWSAMLRFALGHPAWRATPTSARGLDDVVYELLGCHFGLRPVGQNLAYTELLGRMEELFAQAARQWFCFPKVVQGFCELVVQPSFRMLLCPTIGWLDTALQLHQLLKKQRGDDLIVAMTVVLRIGWTQHRSEVAGTPALRQAFLNVLTIGAASGHSAAIGLREELADSLATGH